LNIAGIKNTLDDSSSLFEIEAPLHELILKWNSLSIPLSDIDSHISTLLAHNPTLLEFSKWGIYLPERYKVKLLRGKYYEVEQTKELLSKLKFIVNE
jgi:ATP-dependent Lhr-like helicase